MIVFLCSKYFKVLAILPFFSNAGFFKASSKHLQRNVFLDVKNSWPTMAERMQFVISGQREGNLFGFCCCCIFWVFCKTSQRMISLLDVQKASI